MPAELSNSDLELRHRIYRHFAETGRAPDATVVAAWSDRDPSLALSRLHDAHAIVVIDGAIRMALPFSAHDVGFAVVGEDRSWWANCAWDSLAIPIALAVDAAIEANWADAGEPVALTVTDGELSSYDGFVGFAIPARHWWDDIVET